MNDDDSLDRIKEDDKLGYVLIKSGRVVGDLLEKVVIFVYVITIIALLVTCMLSVFGIIQ